MPDMLVETAQLFTKPLTQQRGTKPPLTAAGSVSSAMTLAAAPRKLQRALVELSPFEPVQLSQRR